MALVLGAAVVVVIESWAGECSKLLKVQWRAVRRSVYEHSLHQGPFLDFEPRQIPPSKGTSFVGMEGVLALAPYTHFSSLEHSSTVEMLKLLQ